VPFIFCKKNKISPKCPISFFGGLFLIFPLRNNKYYIYRYDFGKLLLTTHVIELKEKKETGKIIYLRNQNF
jgi:hypothetical protein